MIKVTGAEEFIRGLDAWVTSCENLATGAFKGLVAEAFKYVVTGTPEWSGNLAANWRVAIGSPTGIYTELFDRKLGRRGQPEPFNRHSPNYAAITYAYKEAAGVIPAINLSSNVVVFNPTPYAGMVELDRNERGIPFIRSVNHEIEMVHSAANRFGNMGSISEAKALALGKLSNMQAAST